MGVPKHWSLKKVKVLPSGGVEAEYAYQEEVEGQVDHHVVGHTCDKIPHHDLTNALAELRTFLASTHGIGSLAAVLESSELTIKQKEASKTLKKLIERAKTEQLNLVSVSGIALSGDENNRGVIITGGTELKNKKTALNSPRIRLSADVWGWEANLTDVVEKVESELELYLFHGKRAAPELFSPAPPEEEKEAA